LVDWLIMREFTRFFVDPVLPQHLEAERQRIIIFRNYLAIIFTLYVLGLILELIFDFKSFNWFTFASIMMSSSFFMMLSLINIPHKYILTSYFIGIIVTNELQFLPNPTAFHVSVFWIGISPLYVAPLAKPRATLIWTMVFIATLVFNGLYVARTTGAYEITLYPDRFLIAGILFMLTTSSLAVFFSYTQKKMRDRLDLKNMELHDLTKEIEDQNTKLKNYNDHLEERVYERTEELEHQNKQLAEYAFINSHLLRAPLASILGVIDLLSRTELTKEQKEYIEHLISASTDLDEVVAKINKALNTEGKFNRETIQKLKERK